MARVEEVGDGIYRISTTVTLGEGAFQFNRIHPTHGGSLPKEVVPNFARALREEEFAFEGKIFGRMIPG